MRAWGLRVLPILIVMLFLSSTVLFLPSVRATSVFTSEPDNPVFPTHCGETSIIKQGDQLYCWFASGDTVGGVGYDHLWFCYADKDDLGTFSEPVEVMNWSIRFPTVVEWNGTYYCFASKSISGQDNIWLWSAPNPVDWSPMNGGNPVITLSADPNSQWYKMWNSGVVVVDDIFHVWVECGNHSNQDNVRLGYTYSSLNDMNWDDNKTENNTIDKGGSPSPVYVGSQNAILLFYSWLDTTWKLRVTTVNMTDDLSDPDSYTTPFDLGVSDNGADSSFCEVGSDAEHNLVYLWFHGQPDYSDIYEEYSDLSLREFFGLVCGYALSENWMDYVGLHSISFRNNGINKYFANESDTLLGVYTDVTIDQIIVVFYSEYSLNGGDNLENSYVNYYEPASNELKPVVYYPDIPPIEYPWLGTNVTLDYVYVNDTTYLEYTVYYNFTQEIVLEKFGTYVFTIVLEIQFPEENFAQIWFTSLYRTMTPLPSDVTGTGDSTSTVVMSLVWLIVVFLPALLLNSEFPRVGFLFGIILMGFILMLVNAPPVPLWNFFMLMMGVVILMFRGDD